MVISPAKMMSAATEMSIESCSLMAVVISSNRTAVTASSSLQSSSASVASEKENWRIVRGS